MRKKKKTPKLPKRISLHISPNYSNRSFNRTFSRGAVISILVGVGVFVAGVAFMLVYALSLYGQLYYVESVTRRNQELELGFTDLPELRDELDENAELLERIKYMLGVEKPSDTVDYTELVFHYRPIMPPDTTDDTLSGDSLEIGIVEEEGMYYPQVPPLVSWTQITRRFSSSHPGIDFATSEGRPVRSVAEGVVSKVGYDTLYGNYIKIQHGKYYETFYGHLSVIMVEEKDPVAMNDVIGFVGNTGQSSAPHLHFEVHHEGTPIDPANFLILTREYKAGAYD